MLPGPKPLLKAALPAAVRRFLRSALNRSSSTPIMRLGWHLSRTLLTRLRIRSLLGGTSEIKLELGSGPKRGTRGWTTLDVMGGADLYWDLRRGLPFPDGCVSEIYSSHVLEHLSHGEICSLLKEAVRVLRAGGSFRICVPNASLYVQGYVTGTISEALLGYKPALYSQQRMDILNYMAYMSGQHKYMFDKCNLLFMLKQAGFKEVGLRDFDPLLDLPERRAESIHAEAKKLPQV